MEMSHCTYCTNMILLSLVFLIPGLKDGVQAGEKLQQLFPEKHFLFGFSRDFF